MTGASGARIKMPDGDATLPPYGWTSDDDTGWYFATAEQKFSHSAAERLGLGASSVATTSGTAFTQAGNTTLNSGFRLDTETVKTTNYTATATDAIIVMNATTLTLSLPASPATNQLLFVRNNFAGNLTIARNGSGNINGAAADLTVGASTSLILHYTGTQWWVIG